MTMLPRVIPMPDRKAALVEGLADHLGRHRESYFAVCLVLAALVPVLAVKLPPMADLLGHMGRYSIQTDLEQHPWLKQYYGFEWQVIGNLGTDLLVELLHPFYGVETSVRLIVILNQLLAAAAVITGTAPTNCADGSRLRGDARHLVDGAGLARLRPVASPDPPRPCSPAAMRLRPGRPRGVDLPCIRLGLSGTALHGVMHGSFS